MTELKVDNSEKIQVTIYNNISASGGLVWIFLDRLWKQNNEECSGAFVASTSLMAIEVDDVIACPLPPSHPSSLPPPLFLLLLFVLLFQLLLGISFLSVATP